MTFLHGLTFCFLVISTGTGVASQVSPRTTIALDGEWRFTLQEGTNAWASPRFDDSNWEAVRLPHTWNGLDGQDGGGNYYRGTGWYRTRFRLPPESNGRRVLLEFDAASRQAEVFLNGEAVGSHMGAFARFRFDVTKLVQKNEENLLAVRVNNVSNEFIPRRGDFTQFGGLYRPARLLLTHPVHVATLDFASPGVFLFQRNVNAKRADVEARVKVVNDSGKRVRTEVRVTVRDNVGATVKAQRKRLELAAGNDGEAVVPLSVENPHLWNGVADPYLYRATSELLVNGGVVDSVEQPLGLRALEFKADAGLLLNGKAVRLRGVNRHQDRKNKGWAISEADQREDFAIIRELGANAVRLAHYQHDQFFYDLCDAAGIAVWPELCWVSEPPDTEQGLANAVEQLQELIRQNFNHPSIFCWSIANETARTNAANSLLARLAEVVRKEDPTRPSTYASQHLPKDPRNFHTDILGLNKYFGWYLGGYTDFGEWIDQYHKDYPELRLGISEYGAGASVYQHEENPPVRVYQNRGRWHPEEWQARVHEETWLQMKERPFLWGTFIWNLFDFASDSRSEGDHPGINDKGLVTFDRQTRKDAFYWYQANWTSEPMVYITSKRFTERVKPTVELKVYSNGDEVEARLNGESLGRKTSADHRFIWLETELKPGPNRIHVTSYRNGKPEATDYTSWNYRADGDPLPNAPVAKQDADVARRRAEAQKKEELGE
jgi:beta-galactosidase